MTDNGYNEEEMKLVQETAKIWGTDGVKITATCVRVPVFIGHGEAVHVEFESPLSVEQAWEALRDAPGVQLIDKREDGGYITQLDCAGEDAVYVSRVRRDPSVPHGLAFWCVSDNLRKGAALNAIQIAEALVEQGLLKEKQAA